MKAGFFTASLLLVSALTSIATMSIGSESFASPLTPLSAAERAARLATLAHSPWNGKSANKSQMQQDGCTISTVSIQVDDPTNKMSYNYDLRVEIPPASKPVPVVIIVPTIMGTQDYVEPVAAHTLCGDGIGTIIADVNDVRDPAKFPAWGAEDINSHRAILALETVVDFAQRVPQFDKTRVGALGFSLGAITTAMWAGVDPRLKAVVTVVGGGNMPYTLAHSDNEHVTHLREERMRAANMQTADQYDAMLRSTVKLDPFYFAPLANKNRIMMVLAESDTKVPYVVQQEQYEAFGQPQSLTFLGGHEMVIGLMVYMYMDDVKTFFMDKFAMPNSLIGRPITHKVVDLRKYGYP